MKVGEAVAEIMKREGIEILCGYPVNHLLEYAAAADIRPIIVRQERIGIHMADAISRVTSGRKIGAFCMQHGPGSENAYGGVAQSYSESVPLLVIPQGYPRRIAGIDPNFSASREMRGVAKISEHLIVAGANSPTPCAAPSATCATAAAGRRSSKFLPISGTRRSATSTTRRSATCEVRSRSGGCAQGGRGDPGGEAAGDLRRHRRALGRSLAAASQVRRTARRAGHHQPGRQERVPGEPSAVARLGRQRGAEDGAPLRREVRSDHRHRLLVHRDQLRHQVPQGEEVHPRHARSEPPEQGRGQRHRPGGRCRPDARCADRRTVADHQVEPRHQATWWPRSPQCARSGWRSGSRCSTRTRRRSARIA